MELDTSQFSFSGGEVGCLLIHGGGGSPPEMRGMGEYLNAQGLTVHGIRLPGHGTTPEDLATKTWKDFIGAAEGGLHQMTDLCQQVFVAGLSMGGLITLYLAAKHSFNGAIVMGTPMGIQDWRFKLVPIFKWFIKWDISDEVPNLTDPDAVNRIFFYRRRPVSFGHKVLKLIRAVRHSLPKVKMPILIMQGNKDETIITESAHIIHSTVASLDKELFFLKNSGHAITVDTERQQVWKKAYEFIQSRLNPPHE